jgi:NADPH2:quinone reductase
VEPLDPQILNQKGSLFLTRPSLGHYTGTREELLLSAGRVFEVVKSGAVKIRISRTFPLREAARAHVELEARRTTGSIVLLP